MFWRIIRSLLFLIDAERAHHLTMGLFSVLIRIPFAARLLGGMPDKALQVRLFGRTLRSPVGLAAGFDKDARWFEGLSSLGFGFIEVGTVTAHPQPGNPKPRLFRLPRDGALLNRFGFNNEGSEAMRARLEGRDRNVVLGVNIGKSKVTPNEQAVEDYLASFDRVCAQADYIVVNVSSPNTPGLRQLQDRDALSGLLGALAARNVEHAKRDGREPVPLFVKIAPDLSDDQLQDVVALALEHRLAGIVATNTTINRDGLSTSKAVVEALGAGGVSGRPLTMRSREIVAKIHRWSGGKLMIIGVGGIMTSDDVWEMLRAGASLVQVYTGFIYGGPGFIRRIEFDLARRLGETGQTIDTLIGSASGRPSETIEIAGDAIA